MKILSQLPMEPVKVTAWMSSAIALYDDWSPDLPSLLAYILFDSSTSPSRSCRGDFVFMVENMPILKSDFGQPGFMGNWYFACSAPCYHLLYEETTRYRKRWEITNHINWGKRKPKINTSEGAEKNYDLPLPLRGIERIDWFAMGNIAVLEQILGQISHLGKKRRGIISKWQVQPISEDWHLYRNNELMRPIPMKYKSPGCLSYGIREWGWRPPVWQQRNQDLCAMPVVNVVRDFYE